MKKSIKKKILFISISFTLIMGLLVAGISYSMFYHYNKNNLRRTTEVNVQHITDAINEQTDSISQLVRWCQLNARLLPYQLHGDNSSDARNNLYENLNIQYNSSDSTHYLQRLVVSNFSDYFIQIVPASYATAANVPSIIMAQDYFETAVYSDEWDFSMGIVDDPLIRSSKPVLPILRPIYHPYNSSVLGWVLADLQPALFCDVLEDYAVASDSTFYVTIDQHVYVYEDHALSEITDVPWQAEALSGETLYDDTWVYPSANGSPTQYVTRPLHLANCYITQSIPTFGIFPKVNSFFNILAWMILLVIFSGLCYTLYLDRTVNRPVNILLKRLKCISGGDFSADPMIEWSNEFGDIGRGINELSGSVQKLIDARIEIENEKREYEYQMLQSQINPHFLYNTLNSIKWMASIQNATGIPEMTTALSRLLKSIAKDSRQRVPLQTELDFLNDYYTIQKYRYGGTITMDVQITENSLLENEILRFTLQPIVENAIFHGIEPKGAAGTIVIRVYESDQQQVCIDITDDGVGMDEATLSGLLTNETKYASNFFRDIGISNVHKRLQYEYGDTYGLSFTSEIGVFTTATITLPHKRCDSDCSHPESLGGTLHV